MGRTARQGQRGHYSMVLLQQDTPEIDTNGKKPPKVDTLEFFDISEDEIQSVARADMYSRLSQKRDKKRIRESEDIEKNLAKAKELDKLTHTYFGELLKGNSNSTNAASQFKILYDTFKAMKSEHAGLHVVFCLDESGSMQGLFPELVRAYTSFVGGDQGKNPESRLSVIMFNDAAHCIFRCQPFSSAPTLPFRGGGTNFSPALQEASTCFKGPNVELLLPVLIFMTDGQTEDPKSALDLIEQLVKEVADLQVHLVGFGDGADVNFLHEMKSKTKDKCGFVHSASIGELQNKFREIDKQLAIAEYH